MTTVTLKLLSGGCTMPQPEGAELNAIRARRDELRAKYLRTGGDRATPPTHGFHHVAFVCKDVEQTIRFYQEFLGFPLVELVENRDYAGSSHFFFDVGNGNLLGFFDFPGHDHPDFQETIGAIQHIALSTSAENFTEARAKLDREGVSYAGPDRGVEDSLYLRDPNGIGLEFYREQLGVFNGHRILEK
jgi:glyoxylase I family protein